MFFRHRSKDQSIDKKEEKITKLTQELHKRVRRDQKNIHAVNEVLDDRITLMILKASNEGTRGK